MRTAIINGLLLTPEEQIRGSVLFIDGERILGIEPAAPMAKAATVIDARGFYVVPGLIDIHVHGARGYDVMDATSEAIQAMGRFMAQHGVTSYLPTTVTATAKATVAAIENIKHTSVPADGARHMGAHLEGPYLNKEYRGAQPAQHLRTAAREEYAALIKTGQVRLITVAPEIAGVPTLLEAGRAAGIEFAVGHSGATYEQVTEAIAHGLRQVTHTFNGMPPLHHRTPGVVGAALSDRRLRCQIIADGTHVHPAVVKLLVNAKGPKGTILITDAMRGTGMPDGDYTLGDQTIHVAGGVARTEAGGLAGSTLTLDQALRNVMQFADLSLQEALPMATRTPAAAMGWEGRKGVVAVGADADLVLLDNDYQVRMTMVGGRVVYSTLP
jgi:N-acetylglucosamine-6-phosphate deacetylase